MVWVLGRLKKRQKRSEKLFYYVFNKYESVTHVSISIFQGLFKNIVFRYVALVTKKLWAIFFPEDWTFSRAAPNPIH